MAGSDNFRGKKIGTKQAPGKMFREPSKAETSGKMNAGKAKKK